jgi:hypothetical protein
MSIGAIGSKGPSITGLAVVSVKVKIIKGQSKPGLNSTFCTERLMQQLGLDGKKSMPSLTTLVATNALTECSIVHLEILDLSEEHMVELPKVFETKSPHCSSKCAKPTRRQSLGTSGRNNSIC